jgi:hypothetical protein
VITRERRTRKLEGRTRGRTGGRKLKGRKGGKKLRRSKREEGR